MKFDKIEEDIAKEIINIGLSKAADSLSFFTRETVFLQSTDFQLKKGDDLQPLTEKKGSGIHVLTTEIKGDMQGFCFLIFDQKEIQKLFEISLPENMKNDPEKQKMMGEAILKEADNIITAAVVTQFSNLLDVNIHGYVPFLDVLEEKELQDFIQNKVPEQHYALNFNTTLSAETLDITPEFLWVLDATFVSGVKKIASDQEVTRKIEALKETSK